jgi:hypothetical protein
MSCVRYVTNLPSYSSLYSSWLVSYTVTSLQPGLVCRRLTGNDGPNEVGSCDVSGKNEQMMCVEAREGEMVHITNYPEELSLKMCEGDCDDDLDCGVSF